MNDRRDDGALAPTSDDAVTEVFPDVATTEVLAGVDAPTPLAADPAEDDGEGLAVETPRIRWAGIIWGTVLAAVAALLVVVVSVDAPYASVVETLVATAHDPDPVALATVALVVGGGLLLVTGSVLLAHRAQRR